MPLVIDDLMFILVVVWGSVVACIIAVLAYWLIPIERRARFLSVVTKKAYGIIEIVGKGKHITKHLANFFEDYAIVRGGVFVFNPDYVYIKDGARCIHFDEKDAFEPSDFTDSAKVRQMIKSEDLPEGVRKIIEDAGIKEIKQKLLGTMFSKGMPTIDKIYLTPVNMRKIQPKEKVRDPQMVNAIFMKQKALAESEALLKIINMLKILLLVAAGAAAIAAVLGYLNYDILSGGGLVKDLMGVAK